MQNIKKLKGNPLQTFKISEKKSHKDEKTEKGDPLVSPVLYVTRKRGITFLVQFARRNGQFDTLEFRITLQYYFVQFVWIEKKVTCIVAFHSVKRLLKIEKAEKMFFQFDVVK